LRNFIYLFPFFSFRNLLPVTIHKMCHRILSDIQKIIQIYSCLLKLSCKQDTILKIGDFSNKKLRFSPKTLASNISMLEPIQVNDNYKPHAKNYGSSFILIKIHI
jgi:hypothetical protein